MTRLARLTHILLIFMVFYNSICIAEQTEHKTKIVKPAHNKNASNVGDTWHLNLQLDIVASWQSKHANACQSFYRNCMRNCGLGQIGSLSCKQFCGDPQTCKSQTNQFAQKRKDQLKAAFEKSLMLQHPKAVKASVPVDAYGNLILSQADKELFEKTLDIPVETTLD